MAAKASCCNTIGYTHRRQAAARSSTAPRSPKWSCPMARRSAAITARTSSTAARLGFGRMANSLTLGCDCLGAIHYFDAVVPDVFGNPRTIENCICLHEEDAGLSWKHFDVRIAAHRGAPRPPARDLLDLDDRQLRIRLLLVPAPGRAHRIRDEGDRHHQHGRLPSGPARQIRHRGRAGHRRPHPPAHLLRAARHGSRRAEQYGRGMRHDRAAAGAGQPLRQRLLRRGEAAARGTRGAARRRFRQDALLEDHQSRTRRTGSAARPATSSKPRSPVQPVHPSGQPLRPRGPVSSSISSGSRRSTRKSASRPANSSTSRPATTACRAWTAKDRPIENTDIVLWHSFGVHHVPRPEDHPVQPCVVCGFTLVPVGFFDQNPVIDLPPQRNAASCCA